MGAKPRKFPRPTKVRIKGLDWTVSYVAPDDAALVENADKDETLLGCCIEHQRAIFVDKTANEETLKDTLVHEIAHAAYRTYAGLPEDEVGEEAVVKFATELFWIVRDALKL